jgi:hypothetical protein
LVIAGAEINFGEHLSSS